ncbi:MAG: hypothetical protein ABIR94_13555 [Rubrivivax sp.]
MRRSLLRTMARWTVGVLLFGQLAIAAHACQVLADAGMGQQPFNAVLVEDQRGATDAASMAGCADMSSPDRASPNLCVEHCRFGQQSDHTLSVVVPVAWPMVLYDLRLPSIAKVGPQPPVPSLSDLVAASPPHAILHCVRRT